MLYLKSPLLNFIAPLALIIATAPSLKAETLGEALRAVHAGNAKLLADRNRVNADGEKISQARAGFLPTISAVGNYGIDKSRNLNTGVRGTTYPGAASINFSQPLFNGFRNIADYQKAQDEVQASIAANFNTQQQTLIFGAQAYMRVLRDRRILSLRHGNLSDLRQNLAQASGRFKAGDMTLTGVDQTKSRVMEAEADVAQSKADLADSEAFYRYIVGNHPGALSAPALNRIQLPCNVQDAILTAEHDNPQLQTAAFLDKAAEKNIKVAKSALYPTVSLDGAYRRGLDDSKVAGAKYDDATLSLKMSVPIFNGGLDASRIRQAQHVKSQRELELTDTYNLIHRSVTSSWDMLHASRLRKNATSKRVAATQAAIYGLNVEYKAGQIAIVNVLDGRRESVVASVANAMADYDASMNTFNLLAAMGRLDLSVIDALSMGQVIKASHFCRKSDVVARHTPRSSVPLVKAPVASHETSKTPEPVIQTPSVAPKLALLPANRDGALSFLFRKNKEQSVVEPQTVTVVSEPINQPLNGTNTSKKQEITHSDKVNIIKNLNKNPPIAADLPKSVAVKKEEN